MLLFELKSVGFIYPLPSSLMYNMKIW
ncbi:uncharacterized protein METZ01_LOCUS350191 [marine metagenome]|uniref:Uncharacterized protein n=1 Tax=marine metagenome TaxID=408172 RepID=A0A382RJN9_9ZZZZ